MGASRNVFLAASLALAGAAFAADPALRYNVVELQAEAQRELSSDTVGGAIEVLD